MGVSVPISSTVNTVNFGTLRDSLVRDRRIRGIRDSKLREDLLKVADLDLDGCLNACRVSELSKERNKAIEASSETVHNLKRASKKGQNGKDEKYTNGK